MILEIDDKLVSSELFNEQFACDIASCLGICCVHGDSGAPLDEEEKLLLENDLPQIEPYLKPEGITAIQQQGVSVIDFEGDLVTPLINSAECAYSYYTKDGICFCGIEKAYFEGKTSFRKPISCHLYPIRLKQLGDSIALNYDRWIICQCAREKGAKEKTPVFRFLKEAITRKFGEDFYNQLEEAYNELKNYPSLQ